MIINANNYAKRTLVEELAHWEEVVRLIWRLLIKRTHGIKVVRVQLLNAKTDQASWGKILHNGNNWEELLGNRLCAIKAKRLKTQIRENAWGR